MSCVNAITNVDIELEEFEKETLIRAYKILSNITDDMWAEDLEDTEEAIKAGEARDFIERFLTHIGIDCYEMGI